MPMYGVRDRSPFVQYNTSLTPTKQGANGYSTSGNKRYYSSIDAEIYFGSYFIDEIVHIGYQIEQSTLPLFGYNAYVYDEMALGSRLINGQFTINFTRPGYLFELLDLLAKENIATVNTNVEVEDDGATEEEKFNNKIMSTDYKSIDRRHRPMWYTGFDINIMFGQESSGSPARHVMLEGVHISNSTLALDPSGQPVAETYSFIARDMRPID